MPFTGPTKKGMFSQGAAATRAGKLAKVPPVMQARTAPARKAMTPGAEKPSRRWKRSTRPRPTTQ